MTNITNKFLIEGIDALGKTSLVAGIQHKRGYHAVMHSSKPIPLDVYEGSARVYQENSFRTMFSLIRDAKYSPIIFDRAHLGECVYAPLYRNIRGDYVFELEAAFNVQANPHIRLILLVEDFSTSKHFVDDGLSFDPTRRIEEQNLFLEAFERSIISDKRIVCVTNKNTGDFRNKEDILQEVINDI